MPPESTSTETRRVAKVTGTASLGASITVPAIEERLIVVAQGLQFHNSQLPAQWRTPDYLKSKLGAGMTVDSSGKKATYTSSAQRVKYTIQVVTTKEEFKKYCETDGAHVVYGGHARYGRGPCFGDSDAPGEDWGRGVDTTKGGIFRMAYPVLAVPVSEILKHKYTCVPLVTSSSSKPPRNDCHPDVVKYYGAMKRYDLGDFPSDLKKYLPASVSTTDTLWAFTRYYHGKRERFLVLNAGWEKTPAAPFDLGAITMKCKVFCHFGCSTLKHNYKILRFRKNWKRTGTDRFAYWTTAPAYGDITHHWLYHTLTYPKQVAYQPRTWKDMLDYVVRETNTELRAARRGYRVR